MKISVFIILTFTAAFCQEEIKSSKWNAFEFLIGKWEGTGTGKFGDSKVYRDYDYFMGDTYLLGKNQSVYEKQELNPEGEIHDDWDIFSYDKIRKKFMIRQFHAEDITNTYSMDSVVLSSAKFEFETEAIENFGTGWKAKLEYRKINNNEFTEIFYLSPPGKEYTEYVRNIFRRKN